MHQHPRGPPITASPANSPRTNPARTNNPRDPETGGSRSGSDRSTPSEQGIGVGEGTDALMRGPETSGQGRDSIAKLSQVIQNFYTKAALVILQARVALPPAYAKGSDVKRVNKWFNVELDETDALRDDVRIWKNSDAVGNRPPSMVVETFLDTEELAAKQALVITDDQGRRWDVEEALGASADGGSSQTRPDVILERWQIQLGESSIEISKDLGMILPRIYKNSIVLFRSLYTLTKLLPAWGIGKKVSKPRSSHNSPRIKYRILDGSESDSSSGMDNLSSPLFLGQMNIVEHFSFGTIETPAGPLTIQVSYRSNCDFLIADSEALLSSHFMGMDEQYFEPSLGRQQRIIPQKRNHLTRGTEVGSLPPQRRGYVDQHEQGQAYGSLSTFHQVGAPSGSSPISALRAARDRNSQSPSSPPSQSVLPHDRSVQGSRSSLGSAEGAAPVARRTSVSFQPFKTPSLSASPLQSEQHMVSSPRNSIGRASALSALAEARNPYSQVAPSRGSPVPPEHIPTLSGSSSPKPPPVSRYSSSFGHRKAKTSIGGGSRTDDDNNSSGKASIASSVAQPGSGVLAEGGGTSSGSIQTDDDNISEFLKMLDQKKDLKSFQQSNNKAAADASTRRTTAALSKFQRMRDTNAALSDSMSSSLLLNRSSSSSSRQLSSVPAMVAGTSMSISSSPGKPISPHTPHTPAIPSRLSANSIIEYPLRDPSTGRHRLSQEGDTDQEQISRDTTARNPTSGAIDIPNSPRPFHPSYRRSSSVAQQPRAIQIDDDLGDIFPFGMRSASLGAEDRLLLGLGGLAALQDDHAIVVSDVDRERAFGSAPNTEDGGGVTRQQSSSLEGHDEGTSQYPRASSWRPRISRGSTSGRGQTPPHGSSVSSLTGDRGSGSTSSDHRGGRYSFSRQTNVFEEEEPLLFAMSDFGTRQQQSRRSLEDGRGGSSAGASERGDSGPSSRRGSRRGGHTLA